MSQLQHRIPNNEGNKQNVKCANFKFNGTDYKFFSAETDSPSLVLNILYPINAIVIDISGDMILKKQ